MKTLINILCVTLAITFVSVEVQANILSTLSKAAKIAGKVGKIGGKGTLEVLRMTQEARIAKQVDRIIEFVGRTTREKKQCTFHNENINKEDYYNSLLEELSKEDNNNSDSDETLSSDTKELKLDDEIEGNNKSRLTFKKELVFKWEDGRCRGIGKFSKNKLKGFPKSLKQTIEDNESDQ
jgi:hypothetical protein